MHDHRLGAAIIAATTAVGIFDRLAPALGVIVPFVVAYIIRADATARTKQYVAIAVSAVVCLVSIFAQGWGETFTWETLVFRAFLTLGEAQAVYAVVSRAVSAWKWTDATTINQLRVFQPERGLM